MAVQSLKTSVVDVRATEKPTAGASIKKVDGTVFTEVSDAAFDRESAAATQKIDNTTGYFGKTIAQINEG